MTASELVSHYEDSARALDAARRRVDEGRTAALLLSLHVAWRALFADAGRDWAKLVLKERRGRA